MRIRALETIAITIDYQERLVPSIYDGDAVVNKTAMLIRGLRILDVPIVVPRQYPKGLGDIVPEIKEALGSYETHDKLTFSALGESGIVEAINSRKNVIVCGVEAHVCVLQTVLDLISAGYTPVLVADCIGSRSSEDRKYAIKRARDEGAIITTAESVLFEMTERAGTDIFKAISKLVK